MKNRSKRLHWFTLVELIVVITILVILGTIAFLSLGGFQGSARDSARVADINSTMKSLDISQMKVWTYPSPDLAFTVTYSGWSVWTQGVFGSGTHARLGGQGITKMPVDPLNGSNYVYSVLTYGKSYQIKANWEWDGVARAMVPVDSIYAAAGNPTLALVNGTYGGLVAKTQTGGMIYVLAVPSIITSTWSPGQTIEISANLLSGYLLFNGKSLSGASSFNPNVVVFSGAAFPANDSASGITNMMTSLKAAYAGSDLSNFGNIKTLATTTAGQLAGLGSSIITGQLGGSAAVTVISNAPVGTVLSKISAGWNNTCALTTAGGVKCWGYNGQGQLGNGTTTDSLTPVDVTGLTSGVAAISVGSTYSCALTAAWGMKCWWYNGYGQLGNATTTDSLTPVDVTGLTSGVAAISVGSNYSCALTTTGGLKCWGINNYGQLGNGTTTNSLTPIDVTGLTSGATAISLAQYHTCALTTSWGMKCWWYNGYGQLGNATTTDSSTPVNVFGLMSGVAGISLAQYHTCALTTTWGTKCWGYNLFGQLGNGTATNSSTAVDVTGLMSGTSAISAGAMGSSTCALTTTGGVKCWGYNPYGQIGDGTATNRNTPTDVTGLSSGVTTISAGWSNTCALTTAGGVKCWGYNAYGQLGNGTTTNSSVPVSGVFP